MSEAGDEAPRVAPPYRLTTASSVLAIFGGLVMLACAVMVCVSVTMRWLVSASVPGDFEFVQIAVAVSTFAFLPFCQIKRGNIFVDTFTSWLPDRTQRVLDSVWDLAYAVCAGVICWRLFVGGYETVANHTTTMVLGLPIGWAILTTALMAAFLTLVILITAFGIRGRRA